MIQTRDTNTSLVWLVGVVILFLAALSRAGASDVRSTASRTYSDGLAELDRGHVARGLSLIEEAARAGLVEAAHELGRRLVIGDAGRLDLDEGIRWLAVAAARENTQAQYDLALALQGRGRPGDHQQSHVWLAVASRAGHPDATCALGVKRLLGESAAWDSPQRSIACENCSAPAIPKQHTFWPQPSRGAAAFPMILLRRCVYSGGRSRSATAMRKPRCSGCSRCSPALSVDASCGKAPEGLAWAASQGRSGPGIAGGAQIAPAL